MRSVSSLVRPAAPLLHELVRPARRRRGAGPCRGAGSSYPRTPSSSPGGSNCPGRPNARLRTSETFQRRLGCLVHPFDEVRMCGVVGVAQGAAGQHGHGYLVRPRQLGEPRRDRVVEDSPGPHRRAAAAGSPSSTWSTSPILNSSLLRRCSLLAWRAHACPLGHRAPIDPDPVDRGPHGELLASPLYCPMSASSHPRPRGLQSRRGQGPHQDRGHRPPTVVDSQSNPRHWAPPDPQTGPDGTSSRF